MDDQSIQHTRWNCTYHIVFIPKYRRKILYGGNKRDVGEILKKLCEMKSVNLIEGRACTDHIHMYVAIPPKLSISEFMSYLKGKSALMFSIDIQKPAPNGETGIYGQEGIMFLQLEM